MGVSWSWGLCSRRSPTDALPAGFDLDVFRRTTIATSEHEHALSTPIVLEPIHAVEEAYARFGGRCFLLHNVLSPEECEYLRKQFENTAVSLDINFRKLSGSTKLKSRTFADILWSRIAPFLESFCVHGSSQFPVGKENSEECPLHVHLGVLHEGIWEPKGLMDTQAIFGYGRGDYFYPHTDELMRVSMDESSFYTSIIYLDEACTGGATRFLKWQTRRYKPVESDENVIASVTPRMGSCLLFFQKGLVHEGQVIESGAKHILRSDVLFTRRSEHPGAQCS